MSVTASRSIKTTYGHTLDFHRIDAQHLMDQPYYLRVEVDIDLTEDQAGRLAGLTGYAYRATVAGEPLGDYQRDGLRAVWFAADTTKSWRDDVGIAFEEFTEMLPQVVREGSPVRKTNRAGTGTKGTRLIDGLGDVEISLWADSIISF